MRTPGTWSTPVTIIQKSQSACTKHQPSWTYTKNKILFLLWFSTVHVNVILITIRLNTACFMSSKKLKLCSSWGHCPLAAPRLYIWTLMVGLPVSAPRPLVSNIHIFSCLNSLKGKGEPEKILFWLLVTPGYFILQSEAPSSDM